MLSKEEVKKLADLARIEINEKEAEKLSGEMDAILDYVSQVKEIMNNTPVAPPDQGEAESGAPSGINIMREDENPTEPNVCSKELIDEFPEKEDNYLRVKKIL